MKIVLFAVYKCRQCGALVDGSKWQGNEGQNEAEVAKAIMPTIQPDPTYKTLGATTLLHFCDSKMKQFNLNVDRIGICDHVGFRKDSAPPNDSVTIGCA